MSPQGTARRLRRGFTTGTAAAAGAKAAASLLLGAPLRRRGRGAAVRVTLPGGGELEIEVRSLELRGGRAVATVVKDGGDDPDVTNGAEIVTTVEPLDLPPGEGPEDSPGIPAWTPHGGREDSGPKRAPRIVIEGGPGVGRVTRAGLKTPVGTAAINPVPLEMIRTAVTEAARLAGRDLPLRVRVSVPRGAEMARKTMNARLGILGGISILGTSGLVEPMSTDAYRDSIACAVSVAAASGCDTMVFSTGRSSEKVAEKVLDLPREAFITTGDHMGFALKCAGRVEGLREMVVAGQFGKFTKLASGMEDTHCSRSSVEKDFLAALGRQAGLDEDTVRRIAGANTAREIFFILRRRDHDSVFRRVTSLVAENALRMAGTEKTVRAMLVGYEGDLVCSVTRSPRK